MENKPAIILMVGVNGVGKTTTIGKLANHLMQQGRTVLLGAAESPCEKIQKSHGRFPSLVS
mgnify:CR=1 FL=1